MVKVTSSTIDIYTVPSTAPLQRRQILVERSQNTPSTTNLRRKEIRRRSIEMFSDSSDSETSFFDDSDDNDDVTVFFGKHGNKFQNVRDGDRENLRPTNTDDGNCRYRHEKTKSCEILLSPKMQRRAGLKNSKTTSNFQKSASMDFGFHPPTRNFSVPNLSSVRKTSDENRSKCGEEDRYLSSPRLKRKQMDITKSAAFKEIYAHNLRLYSAVLAKQVASTGQIGREMNQIRRNKLKERVLNNNNNNNIENNNDNNTNKEMYKRSNSFAHSVGAEESGRLQRSKRSNSASSEQIRKQLQDAAFVAMPIPLSNSDDDIRPSEEECCLRGRSQSLVPSRDILKRMSAKKTTDENQNEICDVISELPQPTQPQRRNQRSQAAFKRKEQLKEKLDSFDLVLGKTSNFLAKVKTVRKE
ncbi:GATOR2 complex protein WDR24-like [Clytia hemisphaerica]|uniref:Uncharacterized protein n=1 Tax=Clytia hemisphaerica TaxID=252671 RepID=A0A7M5XCD9_9CNID